MRGGKRTDRVPRKFKSKEPYALYVQGRQVLSLQYLHSKMNQWGPE